jgi:TonB family protein
VNTEGVVTGVTPLKPISYKDLDSSVEQTVRRWRYRPYVVNGARTPFCTPVRIELRAK